MKTGAVERRLAAIVSGDIAGFSRLMAEDEDATVRALSALRAEIGRRVRQQRGRIVDFRGDDFLAEFASAVDAVSCAAELQAGLRLQNAAIPAERRLALRLGIHLGDVRVEGEQILGDGVNIAARLEGLAETGGICISRAMHEQVQGKLELIFESMGDQSLKNIPEPVEVFRVCVGEKVDGDEKPLTVAGFGGRPAIAVLPFENLSGDPEQSYFADGICEDLIALLSGWRDFPVVARNSSFGFRGPSVDVEHVSRELGARYVVEGSVRRGADRVRITAQLIDATTGHHVWAERYDRELHDVFAIQDEIAEAIVASIHPELERSEQERAARKEPANLNAWECAQKAMWHFGRLTRDDNSRALALFERATALDPDCMTAHFGLALANFFALVNQWSESPADSIDQLHRAGQTCVALDAGEARGQLASGLAYTVSGPFERAIAAFELAVSLDPSLSLAWGVLAAFLPMVGRTDEAIAAAERAMRLSPRDPLTWVFQTYIGVAHFTAGRDEEAVLWLRRGVQRRPDYDHGHRLLAAALGHLGRIEEAQSALAEAHRIRPEFSGSQWRQTFSSADHSFRKRIADGLRLAGDPSLKD